MVRGSNCLAQFYKKARTRKGEFCKPLRRKTLECASFLSTHDTETLEILGFQAFFCFKKLNKILVNRLDANFHANAISVCLKPLYLHRRAIAARAAELKLDRF